MSKDKTPQSDHPFWDLPQGWRCYVGLKSKEFGLCRHLKSGETASFIDLQPLLFGGVAGWEKTIRSAMANGCQQK